MKRTLAILLAAMLMVGMFSVGVSATEEPFTTAPRLSAGLGHSIALRYDGTVWAWGTNQHGRLGQANTSVNMLTPRHQTSLTNSVDVAAGARHSVVARADGTVWSFGDNNRGQLGNGTTTGSAAPVQTEFATAAGVVTANNIVAVEAGFEHSMALDGDGYVWTWGSNDSGQLGIGAWPMQAFRASRTALTNVVAIAAGWQHSMALRDDGTVWVWGRNDAGQVGDGSVAFRGVPTQAQGPNNIIAIAAGDWFNLALCADGTIWRWGDNIRTPVQITNLNNVAGIAASERIAFAWLTDGTVWTIGTTTHTQVEGVSNVILLAASRGHRLALRENGHIAAWGGNSLGQLGIGNSNAQSGVVQVRGTTLNQSDLRLLPAPSRNLTWLWILLAVLVATAVAVFVFVL